MYARPFVGFTDHSHFDPGSVQDKDIADRLEFVTSVVYPAIQEYSNRFKTKYATNFNAKHRILNEPLPVGSRVIVRDGLRADKTSPRPFRVVRLTKGIRLAWIKGMDLLELVDPPIPMQTENAVEVEKILADQDQDGVKYFLGK